MALTVSRRTMGIALGVVVVLIIITMVVVRMRSKSNYAYPDAVAGTKVARTVATGGVALPSSGVVTLTTTVAHGYAAGDVVLIGSPVITYVILASPAPTSTAFSINAAATTLAVAQTLFPVGTSITPPYKTLSDALEECNVTIENGGNADTCIKNATEAYYTSMCPWTNNNPTSATVPGSVWTAYQTFMTNIASSTSAAVTTVDTNSVGSAYNGVKNAASADMMRVVNAARKADITGATRKYLSTVCPNYYVSASGTATPSTYSAWGVFSGAQFGVSAPTYYFNAALVKFASAADKKNTVEPRLKEWAKYAAVDPNAANPVALITGSTLFSATTAGSSVPNYKLAQQYGPGTVNTGLGFNLPWIANETTFTVPNTYVLN